MNQQHHQRSFYAAATMVVLYFCFGLWLVIRSFPARVFSEADYIYDLIWLDAWGASFVVAAVFVWLSPLAVDRRMILMVGALGWFGFVATALMFAGTPFGLGGYGGDMIFRTAMVLRYKTFLWPVDFYYQGLPTFYPPVYYWLLGVSSRVLSVEPYHAIKLGGMALFLFGPFLLYWMWRRLLTPMAAALAAIFSFLFVSFGHAILALAPHAFVGNAFFIPWWLYYVEQVGVRTRSRRFYLVGGLIGGLLFMTYYVPFFLGGLILLIRLVAGGRLIRFWTPSASFRWSPAVAMFTLSALFSSPYWAPLIWSMLTIANDAAQQSWHHFGSSGLALKFFEMSLQGLLFFAGLWYLARRHWVPLYRGLLIILASVVPFLLLGSILGALDKPVNLIKIREFVVVMGGPVIAIFLAAMLKWGGRGRRRFQWSSLIAGVVLLSLVAGTVGFAKHDGVKIARQTVVPDYGISPDLESDIEGAVVLGGHHALYSFYPAYAFFFANQHYAHPAADYSARFAFLENLQTAPDGYLFYVALRHNRFGPIDYFHPVRSEGKLTIAANLSNYPNGHDKRVLEYDPRLVESSPLFLPVADGMWLVAETARTDTRKPYLGSDVAAAEQWVDSMRPFLLEAGAILMEEHVKVE
jgi:hypothetical protein